MGTRFDRRDFLSALSCTLGAAIIPFRSSAAWAPSEQTSVGCFLDATAPFIIDDPSLGISSEIILTSDTFVGATGYDDGKDRTEYEICLYAADGQGLGKDGVVKRVEVPALHNTVLPVRDLVDGKPFYGGLIVRVRPATRTPMHTSDLFSSAFVRWSSEHSFDNVHANPDPIVWQRPTPFFYSMPFPPLGDYQCLLSVFNPYSTPSRGTITLYEASGRVLKKLSGDLKPRSSLMLDIGRGEYVEDHRSVLRSSPSPGDTKPLTKLGGTVAITNAADSVKNFAFMMMRRPGSRRFSIDHPIHQSPYDPLESKAPFDAEGRFKVKNILFTPLVFNETKIGGITINSRFHISSGAPMEEYLWAAPFITDKDGEVPWQLMQDTRLRGLVPSKQIERNALKLGVGQSVTFAAAELGLPKDFSGGMSVPISPTANHTLMKVELTVPEWDAYAFTHFRPGLAAARAYQRPAERGGLATDYITSGARLTRSGSTVTWDEVVCVVNIDDKGTTGRPQLELFTSDGLLTRVKLDEVPAFACRHYLLSQLVPSSLGSRELTLRLVDDKAILLMSVVHIDYLRRDIAIDHGSDRFSTFQEFNCSDIKK